ncbi:cysteine desulfurase csdA-csdE [Vibrio ishigakensis]|uniref:Cysteine desulfurase csdA-csdE n=1 Tax=Vibrio ishigakensis TaxID=1481914 RepID=A0A0B8NUW9_9VIBR|nr:SufE family protein [Vibrio ishigakensis]GAM54544.1 cysteine desulfurase csdA-csdE [Vibrio ishigakensis]
MSELTQFFENNPYGNQLSESDIVSKMQTLSGWEQRYRQVIQWGKKLPSLDEALRNEQVTVAGCESQVWLLGELVEDKWQFAADSDARIVRGLIAIALAALNNKTAQEIQGFDIDGYFESLGLIEHLSPSRGNGLKAIVDQIKGMV